MFNLQTFKKLRCLWFQTKCVFVAAHGVVRKLVLHPLLDLLRCYNALTSCHLQFFPWWSLGILHQNIRTMANTSSTTSYPTRWDVTSLATSLGFILRPVPSSAYVGHRKPGQNRQNLNCLFMHPGCSTCNWKSSTLDIIWHNVTTAWQQHPYHDDQKSLNKNGLHYFGQETPSCGCSMGGWGPRQGYQCHGAQQISISLVSVPVFPSVSSSLKNWKASINNQLARFSAASLTFDHTNQVSHFILKSDFQREYPSSQKKGTRLPQQKPKALPL